MKILNSISVLYVCLYMYLVTVNKYTYNSYYMWKIVKGDIFLYVTFCTLWRVIDKYFDIITLYIEYLGEYSDLTIRVTRYCNTIHAIFYSSQEKCALYAVFRAKNKV